MSHIFSKLSSVRLPRPKYIEKNEEHGRESGGVVVCVRCKNIHFKKKWHHPGKIPKNLNEDFRKGMCPACWMITHKTYEGEVLIKNPPSGQLRELLNLIKAFGKRATEQDSQDRVIRIDKNKNGYRVTTTENQLAVKLAKKIRDVFRKKVDLHISHSAEPTEVSRVQATFRS